jgi:hypothetical protein
MTQPMHWRTPAAAAAERFLVNYGKGRRWQRDGYECGKNGKLHGASLRLTAPKIPIHWCGASRLAA